MVSFQLRLLFQCPAIGFRKKVSSSCTFLNRKIRQLTTTSNFDDQVYDVVISGGGMVGTSMACELGQEPLFKNKKILVLEAAPKKETINLSEKYSNRVSALNPQTKEFLTRLGAWNSICERRVKAVKRLQVWESCSDAAIVFSQKSLSEDMAYIVENNLVVDSINQELEKIRDVVEVQYQTIVKKYELPKLHKNDGENNPGVRVHLENGKILQAKLLIGADGLQSLVRQSMNAHYISWDYQQRAIVATLHLSEKTENNVAWQRFLPNGPIALLPLADDLCSLVWTTSIDDAKRLLQLSNESFVDALNSALWGENKKNPLVDQLLQSFNSLLQNIGSVQPQVRQLPPSIINIDENSRASFPLGLGHSAHYVAPRVALIGDSAHRVHPLAGQGVNLGFGDVICLKNILVNAIYNGQDIGSISHLLEYETKRQRHVIPVMATIDGLNRLYSTEFTPLVMLRSIGLTATNFLKPLKERIITQASI